MAEIKGTDGNDTLDGTNGNDGIRGGGGDDTLSGLSGNDSMSGDAGNDRLYGGYGNDVLNGGAGDDVLRGEGGSDRFLFGTNFGTDKVEDNNTSSGANGGDVIEFTQDNLSDLRSVTDIGRGDLRIVTKNGTVLLQDYESDKDRIEYFQFKDKKAVFNGKELVNPLDRWSSELSKFAKRGQREKELVDICMRDMRRLSENERQIVAVLAMNAGLDAESRDKRTLDRRASQIGLNSLPSDVPFNEQKHVTDPDLFRSIVVATTIGGLMGIGFAVAFGTAPVTATAALTAFGVGALSRTAMIGIGSYLEIRAGSNNEGGGGDDEEDEDGDDRGNGEGPTGNEGCNGCPPVVLDLDRDGELALTRDAHGGWVGAGDGLLAVDRDGSGAIDDMSEIAFVEEDTRARTDLEGLAFGFDSNNDGVVNSQDERFSELQVFQDSNGNRVSDPGELMSLEEAGISSIDVSSMPYDGEPEVVAEVNGNRIFGYTDITYDDGSTVMAGDVALAASETDDGSAGEDTDDGTAETADNDTEVAFSDDHPLTAEIAALTATVDQLTSEIAALKADPDGCCGYSGSYRSKVDQNPIYAADTQAA